MNEALFDSHDPAPVVVMLRRLKMHGGNVYCGRECLACLMFKWPQDFLPQY